LAGVDTWYNRALVAAGAGCGAAVSDGVHLAIRYPAA
jgi:hypothetical protein